MYAHDEYPITGIDSCDHYDREDNALASARIDALRVVHEQRTLESDCKVARDSLPLECEIPAWLYV